MGPSRLAVSVHYRRRKADYDGWELFVSLKGPDSSDPSPLPGSEQAVRPLPSDAGPGTGTSSPATAAALTTPRRDAFGAIFRFELDLPADGTLPRALSLLPRWGDWFAEDHPERSVPIPTLLPTTPARASTTAASAALHEAHLYIIEAEPQVRASLGDFGLPRSDNEPRFLTVALHVPGPTAAEGAAVAVAAAAAAAGPDYILAAFGRNGARRDALAANHRPRRESTARAGIGAAGAAREQVRTLEFVLDRVDFAGGEGIGVVPVEKGVASGPVDVGAVSVWWEASMGSRLDLAKRAGRWVPVQREVAAAEVKAVGGAAGPVGALRKTLSMSAVEVPVAGVLRRLIVRYQRYDAEYDGWGLEMWPRNRPQEKVAVPRFGKVYNGAAVFAMDLSLFQHNDATEIVVRLTSSTGEDQSVYVWTPTLSLDVFLLEGESQLAPRSAVETLVTYRRFGPFDDWRDWELHLWAETAVGRPSRVVRVKALGAPASGSAVFDTSSAHFPRGSVVHVQPVKLCAPEQESDGDQRPMLLRDVPRKWLDREIGKHVHISQGVAQLSKRPGLVDAIEEERFVHVRYRRHEDDYSSWKLRVSETVGDCTFEQAFEQESTSKGYCLFSVDRATFGSGESLDLVPASEHIGREEESVVDTDGTSRTWSAKQLGRFCFPPAGQKGYVWLLQGHLELVDSIRSAVGLLTASVCEGQKILVQTSFPIQWHFPGVADPPLTFKRTSGTEGPEMITWTVSSEKTKKTTEILLSVEYSVAEFTEDFLVENYGVELDGFRSCRLGWQGFENVDNYYYDGALGYQYSTESTVFRCFAPTADLVSLVLYDKPSGSQNRRVLPLRRIRQGCWKGIVEENLAGQYYKLLAEGADKRLFPGVEVIDPYSRCNTAHNGRGLITPPDDTPVSDRPCIPATEAIVYELHLRDATIDPRSGVENKGKYLGLTERGTRLRSTPKERVSAVANGGSHDISTCLDHILDMGVTAVQIMPVQDFDNHEEVDEEYRWGYMPVHFNSPDGWYASETTTDARVKELKTLVDRLHKAGLKVIMDVVYNHTAEDANEFNLEARFSFNGLAPRYYYRNCGNIPMSANGYNTCAWKGKNEPRCGTCYSNGSGCGNEFRSEAPMARKFVLDSLEYWVNEYKVDGFRFDLVGLMDTETMTIAAKRLHAIDQNILLYGEPWTAAPTPIEPTVKGRQRNNGFGVFNNDFRDALRGGPFDVEENFLMDGGHAGRVKRGVMGSIDDFAASPLETINYIECHDNRTLYDHFIEYREKRDDSIEYTEADLERMQMLGGLAVLTSQGIPFIQMGQEMCRTKGGEENSYESPDSVNMIRWEWKEQRRNVVEYYRGLIELRKAHHEIFSLETAETIRQRLIFYEELGLEVPDRCIAYRILGPKINTNLLEARNENDEALKWTAVVVLLNPTPVGVDFPLPGADDDEMWNVVVDDRAAGTSPVGSPVLCSAHVRGRSGMVLRKCSRAEARKASLDVRLAVVSDAFVVPADEPVGEYAAGLSAVKTRDQTRGWLVTT